MKTPHHAIGEAGQLPHGAGAHTHIPRSKSGVVAVLVAVAMVLVGCAEQPPAGSSDPALVETTSVLPPSSTLEPRPTGTATVAQPSTSIKPGLQLMEDEQFWDITGRSLEASAGSIERQATELEDILGALPPAQVASFNARFVSKTNELYSWELWGAAYVLNGGCSDDCFDYFRNWVVGQGRDYFKAVQLDPQVLNDGRLSFAFESDDAELLSYAGADAYRRASGGRDLYEDYPQSPSTTTGSEPAGTAWDEDEVQDLYPEITPLP
ncbi:DUF4240 domain-containing protein [Arthrobacter sp. MYb227]|uniref:DUF4240 domain-containing protein n=1 Tax=Arthrobacter sp. MYb227 TaxID=1848601 RepID=UPI0015E334A3|nr:DUF4240 domain-containing protein [Arthrobacter sp. MYb227]